MGKRLMLNKYAPKKVIKKTEQELIFDVEIPFGAGDSELEEVSYRIPNGFHAEIEDNKVVIKKGEQKPAWSEEDETTRNALINLVEMYYGGCINQSEKNRLLDWLKSLKDRVLEKSIK